MDGQPNSQQLVEISPSIWNDFVDGSEIPNNQVRLMVYPIILQGFITNPGGCLGFLNHQQLESDIF